MKNKKSIIFISLITVVLLAIGVTLAYYTSSDTFNNEFVTGTYSIETQETFESPSNWTPGTTTPKTVIATNKGNTPAAVRIKLTPSWQDKDGNPLPLSDGTNDAAIINFASNLNSKWIYQDGYYYYNRALKENKSTTSLIESVTFNPDFAIDTSSDCESVNGLTTCTTTFNDYAGGKYTLQIEVETAQFDQYKNIWSTTVDIQENPLRVGTLMQQQYTRTNTFGKTIDRDNFESVITLDNIDVPATAIDSWDCSAEQNGSVMCWYTNTDNDSKYELYIGEEDGVVANPDSDYTFYMFRYVENFDLSNLDTSNVTSMHTMFGCASQNVSTIDLDLRDLDTSNVEIMFNLFMGFGLNATSVKINIDGWDTSNVTTMQGMFSSTGINSTTVDLGDLGNLNTSNVVYMISMFQDTGKNATTVNIGNIKNWKTSKVINMMSMFENMGSRLNNFELDLSGWDTSNVTSMEEMFYYAGQYSTSFTLNLANWNTKSVTNMYRMFANMGENATTWNIGILNDWDVSKVTNMRFMFYSAGRSATIWNIGTLSNWNTSSLTDMAKMFESAGYNAQSFELNVSNWNVSNVTYMFGAFDNAGHNATTWSIGDLSNWNISSSVDLSSMFAGVGHNSTTLINLGTLTLHYNKINGTFYDFSNVKVTLNLYNNPNAYERAFMNSATAAGSEIIVNYSSAVTDIDRVIATKSNNSNVIKGSLLD